jgi:hypothetical protein
MNELHLLLTLIGDGLVYLANGLLLLLYLLAEQLPALLSLGAGALISLHFDRPLQRRAAFRPGRGERTGSGRGPADPVTGGTGPQTAQILSGIVLVLWLGAQTGMAAPVPWIGAAMWLGGAAVLLVMPDHQRFNQLWFVKTGLAVYALLVIASRIYLAYTAQLTGQQWAALIGSADSAAAIVGQTRGSVTTIILWALWLVAPLGYFSLLVQQLFVNPLGLISPLAGAQDVLKRIRERGQPWG